MEVLLKVTGDVILCTCTLWNTLCKILKQSFSPLTLSPRKAFAALLDLQTRQLPGRQEPSGTLQELQCSHADPCGGV